MPINQILHQFGLLLLPGLSQKCGVLRARSLQAKDDEDRRSLTSFPFFTHHITYCVQYAIYSITAAWWRCLINSITKRAPISCDSNVVSSPVVHQDNHHHNLEPPALHETPTQLCRASPTAKSTTYNLPSPYSNTVSTSQPYPRLPYLLQSTSTSTAISHHLTNQRQTPSRPLNQDAQRSRHALPRRAVPRRTARPSVRLRLSVI
jgi:hypothetical protein